MAQKFYKKLIPRTKVVLSSGLSVQFKTLDGLTGYRATSDDSEIKDYEKYMVEQRYGLSEISEAEYTRDYTEKKRAVGLTQLPTWNREVVGETPSRPISPLHVLSPAAVRAAVGIDGRSDIRMEDFPEAPVAPTTAPAPVETAPQVNLGRRPTQ
jgi:hypothetical protein